MDGLANAIEVRRQVGAKQRDHFLQQRAIASGVPECPLLVEDVAGRSCRCGALRPRCRRGARRCHALDRCDELVDIDRLREVTIHARVQATFAVALHGVRGQRDDRQARPISAFAIADRLGRLEAAHLRHLEIHEHTSNACLRCAKTSSTAMRPFSASVT